MRESKDGSTVGITLRLDKRIFQEYQKIASRANLIRINNGQSGGITAQDVMRHRLASLPVLRKLFKQEGQG